jgi:HSP20 family protein
MQNEMEQLFWGLLFTFPYEYTLGNFTKIPDVDLQEKPDQYIVTVNAPGSDLSSMTIKLQDKILQLSIKTEHADDTSG